MLLEIAMSSGEEYMEHRFFLAPLLSQKYHTDGRSSALNYVLLSKRVKPFH